MESSDEGDADSSNIIPQLVLILVLTLVNAFFAMAELAIISVNKTKIDLLCKEGNKKAKIVQKLSQDQTKFLSTIQVGITLAGFFSSAVAAVGISDELSVFLLKLNLPYAETISIVFVTLILSFFTLIFGELFPKRIALVFPEKISMFVAGPVNVMKIIFTPFVKLLSGTCNLLSKITGLSKKAKKEKISEEEIISIVETGVTDGTLDKEKQKMIESVLKFNDLTATDIMTPRIAVFMIDIDSDIKKFLPKLMEENYTRVPVYKDTRDKIIGVLNVKDLTKVIIEKGIDNIDLKQIIRKPLFVQNLIKINKLFQIMKNTKNQIAILLDEFGGVSGIATMEDIVEEVVGNIYDEYDDDNNITKISEVEYIVSGSTPIQEVNRELDLELEEDSPDYDTIAGLIIDKLNSFPKGKEEINIKNITIVVDNVTNNVVGKVRIIINEPTE